MANSERTTADKITQLNDLNVTSESYVLKMPKCYMFRDLTVCSKQYDHRNVNKESGMHAG